MPKETSNQKSGTATDFLIKNWYNNRIFNRKAIAPT